MKTPIKSKILKPEKIKNIKRKFGSVNTYYPVYIIDDKESAQLALFTISELNNAIDRAKQNPEDFCPMYVEPKPSLISRMLNFKIF